MTKHTASSMYTMTREIEAVFKAMLEFYNRIEHDNETELFTDAMYAYDSLQKRFIDMNCELMQMIGDNHVITSDIWDDENLTDIDDLSVICEEYITYVREYITTVEENDPLADYDDKDNPTVVYYVIQRELEDRSIEEAKDVVMCFENIRELLAEEYPEIANVRRMHKEVSEKEYYEIRLKNIHDGLIEEDEDDFEFPLDE